MSNLTPMFEARDLEGTIASYANTTRSSIEKRLDSADSKPCWCGLMRLTGARLLC